VISPDSDCEVGLSSSSAEVRPGNHNDHINLQSFDEKQANDLQRFSSLDTEQSISISIVTTIKDDTGMT
jgi:hypothetical protein